MRVSDVVVFTGQSIAAQRLRTALILVAMAISVAAVIVLAALGESARQYITGQFSSLGTHLLVVLPGRSETVGGHPPLFGETPRDLTMGDAEALLKSPYISKIAPIAIGSAPISRRQREREANVMGSTADLLTVRHLDLAQGRFLPTIQFQRALPVCVIGQKLRTELFGSQPFLGQWVRIGNRRFRIIGALASEGQSVGVDFDEIVIIPVASAQALFDSPSLFRVLVEAKSVDASQAAIADITRIISARHEGENDITVIAQDSVVDSFNKILTTLTYTVTSIAAISLVVAGILITNVMLVSVSQRTAEIGLLKAMGAATRQIKMLFLSEAGLLSIIGALAGLILGYLSVLVVARLYSTFPITVPGWAPIMALVVALLTGLVSGVLPAVRAAKLDPVESLTNR